MDDTSADLRSLLDRLKGAQHAVIEDAARQPGLPSTAILRKIADLENTIAAVLALIEERQDRPCSDFSWGRVQSRGGPYGSVHAGQTRTRPDRHCRCGRL